jgi:hypothetical protein
MKRTLPILIFVVTTVLVALAWLQSGGLTRHEIHSASTPEEAIRAFMGDIKARDWDRAYLHLANTSDIDKHDFVRDLAGSDGSLRTYSSLQSFEEWPLHATAENALVRVRMTWSSAVGPLDDVRDLHLHHEGAVWKIVWPKPNLAKVPPQVIPVNYLRWDVIGRGAGDDWGVENVDSPQVRVMSMNAVERPQGVVIVGEIVNEDTVPAYVGVNATLLRADGSAIDEESSFDTVSHSLLPKQVAPYRIDFPGIRLRQVKSVRMAAHASLVPASADPVIAVTDQKLGTDVLGNKVLSGDLINQSGRSVDIAQVLAAFYDSSGKVIWVSAGYVSQALLPQVSVPFVVDLPSDIADKVHSYHVSVNHYSARRNS